MITDISIKTSFNQACSDFATAPIASLIVWHLKAVETSFPEGSIFDIPDASQHKLPCRWQVNVR